MAALMLIIVGIVLVALIFLFVKFRYIKHKMSWILILAGVFFLYMTFMVSIAGHDVNLTSIEGLEESGKIYLTWMGNAFENVKTLTTNAVKLDWGVKNPF